MQRVPAPHMHVCYYATLSAGLRKEHQAQEEETMTVFTTDNGDRPNTRTTAQPHHHATTPPHSSGMAWRGVGACRAMLDHATRMQPADCPSSSRDYSQSIEPLLVTSHVDVQVSMVSQPAKRQRWHRVKSGVTAGGAVSTRRDDIASAKLIGAGRVRGW